jgi:hypothetical protein
VRGEGVLILLALQLRRPAILEKHYFATLPIIIFFEKIS